MRRDRRLLALRLALRMLAARRARTALSVGAVATGVAAVITVAAIGAGTRAEVLRQIESQGTNLVVVSAGKVERVGGRARRAGVVITLLPSDARAIGEEVSGVVAAAPAQSRKCAVKYDDRSLQTTVVGSTPEFAGVRNFPAARGEFFTEEDVRASRRVALLGQTVAETLFGSQDPVGEQVRVERVPFTVVGVLAAKGVNAAGQDEDDQVVVPVTTALRRVFNQTYLGNVYLQAAGAGQMDGVAQSVRALLRERHRLRPGTADDFTVQTQSELLAAQEAITATFARLLGMVAATSLLVGGIGILAVMLISVRERIREIGVRRALGARRRDILGQFLLEAALLSLVGAAAGVGIAFLAAAGVGALTGWPRLIQPGVVLLAVGSATGIGLFLGIYPARRAAGLPPVEALRSE